METLFLQHESKIEDSLRFFPDKLKLHLQFKRGSRDGFLAGYRAFVFVVRDCYVCAGEGEGRIVGAAEGGDGE